VQDSSLLLSIILDSTCPLNKVVTEKGVSRGENVGNVKVSAHLFFFFSSATLYVRTLTWNYVGN
jgi:hypothetical protein